MEGVHLSSLSQFAAARRIRLGWQRWASEMCLVGLPWLGVGCAQLFTAADSPTAPIVARGAAAEIRELPPVSVAAKPAEASQQGTPPNPMPLTEPAPAKELAINLDTVLRLAEDQNAQVGQARARVQEACAEVDVASTSWLPALYVGPCFFRHEGGISNEDGRLTKSSWSSLFAGLDLDAKLDLREAVYQRVSAERQLWQQRGELSRISSETLLEAATTYIDLLAAREGEAIAKSLQNDLNTLLEQARKAAAVDQGYTIEVDRLQGQYYGSEQVLEDIRNQARKASAKLVYLLGVDPCVTLVPVDRMLITLDLVNVSPPVCDLVNQALTNGPGIREMEGLLSLIHDSIERAKGPSKYLPVFEFHVAEGGFGTGPGDRQDWDNRLDIGLQARWNLTDLVTRGAKDRVLQAKTEQAHLAYQDLRAKLTAGVQESRDTILSIRTQMELLKQQIERAKKVYKDSEKRKELLREKGGSFTEVLLSLQTVEKAQTNYLNAIRAYDKAQIRLMILLGPDSGPHNGDCPKACDKAK
jgi:outer membrane protein TolC